MITWAILRAAGIGAYLMLWASVAWGLAATTSIFGKKVPKATSIALHQAFSTIGLLLLGTHLAFVLSDRFIPFTPIDLLVPMHAVYHPVGVSFGIAAMFLMVLGVLATSWARKLIGTTWWRRLHSLAVPAFVLALLHGFATGTDTVRSALFWMYFLTTAALVFLLTVRAATIGVRPQRTAPPRPLEPRGTPLVAG